jgi:hypothetical protein
MRKSRFTADLYISLLGDNGNPIRRPDFSLPADRAAEKVGKASPA